MDDNYSNHQKQKARISLYSISLNTQGLLYSYLKKYQGREKNNGEKFNKKIIMEKEKVYNTIRGFQSLCNLPINTPPPSPLAVQQARSLLKYGFKLQNVSGKNCLKNSSVQF